MTDTEKQIVEAAINGERMKCARIAEAAVLKLLGDDGQMSRAMAAAVAYAVRKGEEIGVESPGG